MAQVPLTISDQEAHDLRGHAVAARRAYHPVGSAVPAGGDPPPVGAAGRADAADDPPPGDQGRGRRPNGYWQDAANLDRELRAFVQAHGDGRTMPTAHDLQQAGRPDLAGAISGHGGYRAVVVRIGLACRYRPRGYWRAAANVDAEVRRIWQQLGRPAVLPSLSRLAALGPPGLAGAIGQHGGLRALAGRLGLRPCRTPARRLCADPATLAQELCAFAAGQPDPTRFPAATDLRAAGRADLVTAIGRTGGAGAWAARLGLRPAQRPGGYWTRPESLAALGDQLHARIIPGPPGPRLPTLDQLLAAGQHDLVRGIRATGGLLAWYGRLGLSRPPGRGPHHPPGYWQRPETLAAIEDRLRAFVAARQPPGVLPPRAAFLAAGQPALWTALGHTGGRHAWAERLGLALSADPRPRPARHNQPWTPAEDDILRQHWGVWSAPRLARHLHRPAGGLYDRAAALGLGHEDRALRIPTVARIMGVQPAVVWRWLRRGLLAGIAPDGECDRWRILPAELERFILQHPERVRPAQMDREAYPYFYNLARRHQPPATGHKVKRAWAAHETAYLRNNYRRKTVAELAAYLGRSSHAVNMQLWRLRQAGDLLPYRPERGGGASRRAWTPAEDAYLLAQAGRPRTAADPPGWPRITLAEVAATLGRRPAGVKRHLARLQAQRVAQASEEPAPAAGAGTDAAPGIPPADPAGRP